MATITEKQLRASSSDHAEYLQKLRDFYKANPGQSLPGALKPPRARSAGVKQTSSKQETDPQQRRRRARRVHFPPFPDHETDWIKGRYRQAERFYALLYEWCEFIPGWFAGIKRDRDRQHGLTVFLAHVNGARVNVSEPYGAKDDRFQFSAAYPVDSYGSTIHPGNKNRPESITIARNRAPSSAAADLERRLLVHVAKMWVDLQPRVMESEQRKRQFENRKRWYRSRLQNLKRQLNYSNTDVRCERHCGHLDKYGDISIQTGYESGFETSDQVTIEVNCSDDQARRLWSFIRELKLEHKNICEETK